MAKKKSAKSQSSGDSAKAAKPAGGAANPAAPAPAPLIDTALVAQTAARLLAARARLHGAPPAPAEQQKESGTFRQLKESLNRQPQHVITSALGSTFGEHKSNLPTPGKQVAQSQTQANIARINVPRRTAG
jgi:hypothetical protein